MLTVEPTIDSSEARSRYLVTVVTMFAFVVLTVVCHWQLVTPNIAVFAPKLATDDLRPNTAVFAAVGFVFLVLTVLALVPALPKLRSERAQEQKVTRKATPKVSSNETIADIDPVTMLVVPMAIRFAGTFAILGGLMWVRPVSRYEAVFDVFFWYLSLTTMEVVGIVWASKTQYSSDSIPSSSATKGVL